ncbi:MAG: hypothetical protein HC913_00945 [Microscillaceae bacterium]|nr:hypothetical protein [Microscillaceae bacterium]
MRQEVLYRYRLVGTAPFTTAGVQPILHINPTGNASGEFLTPLLDHLYFSAIGPSGQKELWRSDGRTLAEGGTTAQIADLNPTGGSFPKNLHAASLNSTNFLFFSADAGNGATDAVNINRELWVRNHDTGTNTVFDITAGASSAPFGFITYNNRVYFFANNGVGNRLFASDGLNSPELLALNSNIVVDTTIPMLVSGGFLYFVGSSASNGNELYRFDGTTAVLTANINPGVASANPHFLTDVNGEVFFVANDGTNGTEVWRYDTSLGASRVSNITTGNTPSNARLLTYVNGFLYFFAKNPFDTNDTRFDLWVIDPLRSSCVTQVARRVFQFPANSNLGATQVDEMTTANGFLYFIANGSASGRKFWCMQPCTPVTLNYNSDPAANNALCAGSGVVPPIITGVIGAICPSGNCFCTEDPALVLNPNTGEIDLNASAPGSYRILYTYDNGTCRSRDTVTIAIQQQTQITQEVLTLAGNGTRGETDGPALSASFDLAFKPTCPATLWMMPVAALPFRLMVRASTLPTRKTTAFVCWILQAIRCLYLRAALIIRACRMALARRPVFVFPLA